MSKIYARFVWPDAGYEDDQQKVKDAGLELNQRYVLADAKVYQSSTDVWIEEHEECFNSVHFEYENEVGEAICIYDMPEYFA